MALISIGGGLFGGYDANINEDGTEKTELRYHVSFSHQVDSFSLAGSLYFKHDHYNYHVELPNGEDIINSVEFDYDPNDRGYDGDYWLDVSSMAVTMNQKANEFYFVLRKKPDAAGDRPTFWVDPVTFGSVVEVEDVEPTDPTEPVDPPSDFAMMSLKVSASMSIIDIIEQHNKLHDDVALLYSKLQG